MQRYLVGGAVRDQLLGLAVADRDYVVVGATPQEMLAQGFTPVGKDFPVFLHPRSHEEHALARTERKTAPGYAGFVFHAASDVTLEEDLARRDLTINAMAQADDGSLIDPFDGQGDLQKRLLRHVSPAFLEDPVRILRVARFSARFTDFTLAPETALLMRTMVANGEVDALVPERVWQEFSRGLMEAQPSRMIEVLRSCGALERLLPALAQLWAVPAGVVNAGGAGTAALVCLDAAAHAGAILPVRLAVLMQALAVPASAPGPADVSTIDTVCISLKVPVDCRDLARLAGRECALLLARPGAPDAVLAVLERSDAMRKPERFLQTLTALGFVDATAAAAATLVQWMRLMRAVRSIDAGAIATAVQLQHPGQPMQINHAIRVARIAAIAAEMAL